jgi:MSHA biogenesis protein MshN
MSVINKMLRDLDKRGGLGPRNLEDGLRDMERVAARGEEKRPWGRISAWVIVGALAAVIGWYVLQPAPRPTVAAAKPQSPALAKAPAQVAAVARPAEVKPEANPAQTVQAPEAKAESPAAKVEAPAAKSEARAAKVEAPAAKPEAPSAKVEAPAPKVEAPAARPELAAAKADVTPAKLAAAKSEAPPVVAKAAPATPGPAILGIPAAARESAAKAERAAPAVTKAAADALATRAPGAPPAPAMAASAPVSAPPAAEPRPMPAASVSEPRVAIERPDRNLGGVPRASAEYRSANDLLSQGRVDAALARYADALRSDPRHVPARQSLVVLLLDQGRTTDAQNILREGIAAVPQSTQWPMLLARLQVEGGDVKGGLETLERSLPAAQGQAEYHAFLATLLQMQSRHREAVSHYEVSVRVVPDSGRWLTGLAISLEEEKRIPEAREAYRRALASGGLAKDLEAYAERRLKQLQ